ncbi:MAG: HD domain-containing phosphohydrolase [Terriglobia bacterium]
MTNSTIFVHNSEEFQTNQYLVNSLGARALSDLAKAGRSPADPEVREALTRVASELSGLMQNTSAESSELFATVANSLVRFKGTANADLRVGCLLDVAQYYYVLGQPFRAIEPANAAQQLARSAGSKALVRKSCTFLGVMFADTGNISGAIECYAEALDILRDISDPEAECRVWINLGVALMYAAQYGDANACFEHCIQLSGSNPRLHQFRANAFANIALSSLHLEDFARGLRAAETSIQESTEPKSPAEMLSRVIRENNYARLLLEVNNVPKAAERCEIAKRYAALSKSVRAEILASTIEGLCEVYAGRTDIGISRLTSILEKARLHRPTLRDTLAALVRAFEIIGQPQRALIYLREMMESTRKAQQENSLQHLKIHLELLGDGPSGPSTATTRLERHEAALKGKVAEQELFRSRVEMLERLAVTAELRDDSTGEHSYRVGKLASLLAAEYGCDEDTCFMMELAARLHDVGKIGVPDAILLKPDKLNDAERQIMRTHTTVGAELLSKSNIPQMQMAEDIARYHHEWWDGSGYPGSLSGTAIPLAARITALADVFDALTHKRPYKTAWPLDAALEEISSLKGKQFDRELTDLFLVLVERLKREYPDLDAYLGQAALRSPFLQARSRIWDTLRRGQDSDGKGSDSRLDLQR